MPEAATDVSEIHERARVAMRLDTTGDWRRILDDARAVAQQAAGPRAVAQFAGLAAAYLHREGRSERGYRELALARELADDDIALQVDIRISEAFSSAVDGQARAALRALRQLPAVPPESATAFKIATALAATRMMALQFGRRRKIATLIKRAAAYDNVPLGTWLRLWQVPLFAASGRLDDALATAATLREEARAAGSAWRVDIADTYRHALGLARGAWGNSAPSPTNPNHEAQWQLAMLRYYSARLRGGPVPPATPPRSDAVRAAQGGKLIPGSRVPEPRGAVP